jgi:hypothetical protein
MWCWRRMEKAVGTIMWEMKKNLSSTTAYLITRNAAGINDLNFYVYFLIVCVLTTGWGCERWWGSEKLGYMTFKIVEVSHIRLEST